MGIGDFSLSFRGLGFGFEFEFGVELFWTGGGLIWSMFVEFTFLLLSPNHESGVDDAYVCTLTRLCEVDIARRQGMVEDRVGGR